MGSCVRESVGVLLDVDCGAEPWMEACILVAAWDLWRALAADAVGTDPIWERDEALGDSAEEGEEGEEVGSWRGASTIAVESVSGDAVEAVQIPDIGDDRDLCGIVQWLSVWTVVHVQQRVRSRVWQARVWL